MLHTLQNEFLTVTVSELGAELQSIRSADGTEYLWQGDPAYWKDRSPTLFPFVARLTGGRYQMDGQTYEMKIHGFARHQMFIPVCKEATCLTLELTDSEDTYPQYPRHFTFRLRYTLTGNRLDIHYEVENKDTRVMYFGLGGHPGFQVPLSEGRRFEDYRLRFPEPCQPARVEFTDDCFVIGTETPYPLVNGTDLPLRHDLFDRDAIVLRNMPRQVTLEAEGDSRSVTVSFPDMPNIGFWHKPHSDAPYVCIEPWLSLPARAGSTTVFEEKEDLVALPAGQCWSTSCSVEIH